MKKLRPKAKANPKVKPKSKVKLKIKTARASRPSPLPKTGGVNHVILTVNDWAKSKPFYAALMPRLGYTDTHEFGDFLGWALQQPPLPSPYRRRRQLLDQAGRSAPRR
jgi:hypothetical protein